MKKILITGGHYTPAKAVIDEISKSNNWKIYYIGLKHSFEGDTGVSYEFLDLQHNSSVKFLQIVTGRLQRKFSPHTIPSLLKIPVGLLQSIYWIITIRPDVVLSFGGFVAVPVVIASWIFDVPVVTHEQTTSFGLANKIIQIFAQKVLVSFKSTLPKVKDSKWIFTGNPIRQEIFQVAQDEMLNKIEEIKRKLKLPLIYVTGGKHGSHVISQTIIDNLSVLVNRAVIVLQTGDNQQFKDYESALRKIKTLTPVAQKRVLVQKFFTGSVIGKVYSLSDLLVGRGGANTVFDLAALGIPSILIPIPWSSGNEQMKNATQLASFGGSIVLEQDKIDSLTTVIFDTLDRLSYYKRKSALAKEMVVDDSALKIFKIVESVSL